MLSYIRDILNKARENFTKITGESNQMDVDFVAYELLKDNGFIDCIKSLKESFDPPIEILTNTSNLIVFNYAYNLQRNSDTQEKKRIFFEMRTEDYNSFVIYLVSQIKMMPEKGNPYLAILASFMLNSRNVISHWMGQNNLTLEEIGLLYTNNNISNIVEHLKEQIKNSDINEQYPSENKQITSTNIIKEIEEETKIKKGLDYQDTVLMYVDDISNLPLNYYPKLIGKDTIIKEIEESLVRYTHKGALLVGKSGVGKDTICYGLIPYLKKKSLVLKNYKILRLRPNVFLEGSVLRGQVEAKVNIFVEALAKFNDVILYIENIEDLIGNRPDNEIASTLLPLLLEHNIKILATTDFQGYQSLESVITVSKIFQRIDVKEPSIPETKKIVKGFIKEIEDYYQGLIKFSPKCADLAVTLADKYIFNKCFPQKAIDIVDVVASKAYVDNIQIITDEKFLNYYADYSKIPADNIELSDIINYDKITEKLKSEVIGQEESIEKIMTHVAIGKAGLREDNKTICNIFLKGMSGVGKTLLCQKLAEALNIKLLRFDMSEYSEKHSVAKLLGTPPGYIGFSDSNHGSLLLNALEEHPRCVLLLDEIEKANESIHNVLLQAMDNGKLTSSSGKEVSLKNVILIMTSNVGATAGNAIAFTDHHDNSDKDMESVFKPEFRTRLDDVITMNGIDKIDISKVIHIEINKLNDMLKKYKTKVSFNDEAIKFIENKVKTNNLGLRIVKHIISSDIKPAVIRKLHKKGNIKVKVHNNQLEVV